LAAVVELCAGVLPCQGAKLRVQALLIALEGERVVRLVLFDEKTGGLALDVHGIGDGHRELVADDAHPQTCAAAADPARATRSSLDVKWAWKAR
jgi:hypothetical protein